MNRITGIFTDLSEWNSKSTICRLCMKNNDHYCNIFTSNIECKISVEDVLLDLVGLKISVGDGLPSTMCPLCLENLTKFRVFKKICLESDDKLRKISSRHCFRGIQGDGAADVKVESSDETKDCIQDATEGTSEFACSVQTTEIYIPVPDSQHPRGDVLFNVKEENEHLFSGGNYPAFNSANTAGVSSEASDPLATHDLRNWKQLRKAWDNVKTKRRKAQAQETQRRLATGGGPYVPPVCDPNPELEIAIPSLSHCEQNVGDMDDDCLDSPPIPNASSGHTELEYPTIEALPSDVPCATTVMGGPIRTPSSSGGMTRGAAVERELQDRLEGLKSYNAHRNEIQALRQETAQVELATAKLINDFQLRKVKLDEETQNLQLEFLRLQRLQQEQALANQKRMDDIQIKVKEQELRQMMCNVKEENEQLFSGGNYPAFNSPNTAGVSSEASDPLATHDSVSTASRIGEVDALGSETVVPDQEWKLIEVKKEPSEEESDAAKPNFSETGERIETWTMGNECTTGAWGFPASDGLPVQPTSATYLMAETNARIDLSDDYIAPSSSLTLTEFKTELFDGGDGRNVADEDLEECGAPNTDKMTFCTINDDGQCYRKCIPMSKSSGGGTTSTDVGIRGGCDGPNTVDTIRSNFISDGRKPCSKSSSSKSKRKGSIGNTHNDVRSSATERPYACSVCYKTFPQRGKLNRHMLTHTEGKPFSCSVCGKHYKKKKTLRDHMRLHTGENICVCNECEMPFYYKNNLARHMQIHMAVKPFSCSLCSKNFTTRSNLNCHLRSHAKVKPTHSCRICQESFSLVWQLEEHMRVHPGEKAYECSECKKTFSTKSLLSSHMRTHSKEKP